MNKVKDMPVGVSLFLIFLIGLEIYYFYSFLTYGIFVQYGYTLGDLSFIVYLLILLFLFTVIALSLFAILYGFLNRSHWARKFAIIFILWAALWPLWGLLIGNNVIEHFILLVIYLILIVYLMSSYVKEYFSDIFRYGEYTLYKREVELKSGKILTIYFFSKKIPRSGTPTSMPPGYTVGINKRSNMPYLEKIYHDVYKYGKYKLYKRKVTLKSGKTLIIYFFCEHKPKSGTPTSMPLGYTVGINKRSNMPYLKKDKSSKGKNNKIDTVEENKNRKPSNVIYVVNRPQPGQLRGDWAVRGHGKIYSHHRIKQMAIKQARIIARKRDATVMIQKTDGTFSEGFKPRPKKRI